MVSVKIFGGLGNQMFQYAFAKNLNLEFGIDVGLDISGFDDLSIHSGYMLDFFDISLNASKHPIDNHFIHSTYGKILRRIGFLPRHYVIEEGLQYKKYVPQDGSLFIGYFQSEKFFKDITAIITQEFNFPNSADEAFISSLKKIQDSRESVSIHVRRGDYLSNKNSKIYQSCGMRYYQDSLDLLKQKLIKDLKVFVFSDDIEWAKENLSLDVDCSFVQGNEGRNVVYDMALMSKCSHNIIANSTFSWWAAWLNQSQSKIVISPKYWFKSDKFNSNDIIPDAWIKI